MKGKLLKSLITLKLSGHTKLPLHGKGSSWQRTDLERLLRKLLLAGFLYEEFFVTKEDMAVAYVRSGPNCEKLLSGREQVSYLC